MKIRVLKILIPLLIVITVGIYAVNNNFAKTAFAIGDLVINWGVPTGNPIFVVNNILPGDVESRTVNIQNNASTSRSISVKGIESFGTGNLKDVLDIVISDGSTDLYGGTAGAKTLTQFFTDSSNPSGISLFSLAASGNKNLIFKVTFNSSAGNQYQGKTEVFDIQIGISFDLPAECQGFNFSGQPIFGTQNNDRIRGGGGSQIIVGLEGDDNIEGNAGEDCLIGGPGNDKLDGGSGSDIIDGGDGNNTIIGGSGQDVIHTGSGQDNIDGGSGDDTIFAGNGNDTIQAGSGDDIVNGEGGNDTIDGGAGRDTIDGGPGNDTLKGRSGADTLTGGSGTDSANGETGSDTCDAEIEVSCEL